MNVYKNYAMGRLVSGPNWTNLDHPFVVADAGHGDSKPIDNLGPIEDRAAELGIPVFLQWTYNGRVYSDNQITLENWPALDKDNHFKNMRLMLKNRTYAGVILKVDDFLLPNKEPQGSVYFATAFGRWVERVSNENKSGHTIIMANFDRLAKYAPGIDTLAKDYETCILQHIIGTDESYPKESDKAGTIGNHPWTFWAYTNVLYLFGGTKKMLFETFNFNPKQPPVVPEEPPVVVPDPPDAPMTLEEYLTYRDQEAIQWLTKRGKYPAP